MRYVLIFFFPLSMISLSTEEITSFQEEFLTEKSTTVAVAIDSTTVAIEYWDADYILVETELAYEKKMRRKVFESSPVYTFGVETIREENGTLLIREKEISDLENDYGTIGSFHTLYLPYQIDSIEWVLNISASLDK